LAAQAQVELARLNLDYTQVTAPFDGRMGRHLKDPGTLVGAGEKTLLAEINQIDPIYVYFNINEQDLLRVRGKKPQPPAGNQGRPSPVMVGLADDTGFPHQGQLDFAAISLNPTTGSLMLRAILPNPNHVLLPGMFARVRVPIAEQQQALLVPEAAISYDQIGPYLRVVNEKKLVERRGVKLGVQDDAYRVVQEGLSPHDWVVVSGMLRAVPGREVTPEQTTAAPSAPTVPEAGKSRP
jgi:RND family efflux transporter MFP subunit